ncbi:hypothetical protein ABEF95_013263 [Exophiala dermatitidis]
MSSITKGSPSLGDLPTEILTRILTPLLQHTVEQADEWNDTFLITEYKGRSYAQVLPTPPEDECLQPQVLQVCKRFNDIGVDLLYANNLIFPMHACTYWAAKESADRQRAFLKKLSSPRDERHRLKGLCIIIWTPDFFTYGSRHTDGDWFDELFAGLALHQPCWDEILIDFNDLTARAAYNTDLKLSGRLIYGLGRLHAKSLPNLGDSDVKWSMEQPEHKYPLTILHHSLEEYFDAWEPPNAEAAQIPRRRRELLQRSLQAAEAFDEEAFFAVMVDAVQHVNEVFRQGLKDRSWSQDKVEELLDECEKEGRLLLSARDKQWRAAYGPRARDIWR